MIKHFAIAIFCCTCLALVGCGADNSPDGLAKQQVGLLNEMSDVLVTVKDVPSAEAAALRIQTINERRKVLDKKFSDLKLNPQQHKELSERHRAAFAAAAERAIKSRPKDVQLLRNPKLSNALQGIH